MRPEKTIQAFIAVFAFVFLAFVGLKIFGLTDWSWWWVTSPLWLPVLTLVLAAFIGVTTLAMDFIIYQFKKK